MALIVLLLIVLMFGGGFALKILWYAALVGLILWIIGFFASGPSTRWYRW